VKKRRRMMYAAVPVPIIPAVIVSDRGVESLYRTKKDVKWNSQSAMEETLGQAVDADDGGGSAILLFISMYWSWLRPTSCLCTQWMPREGSGVGRPMHRGSCMWKKSHSRCCNISFLFYVNSMRVSRTRNTELNVSYTQY
jgi:hypothetical protein